MLTYNERPINIKLALELLSNTANKDEQIAFLSFLRQHRNDINDEAIEGLLLFLDDHQGQLEALHDKLSSLNQPLVKKPTPDYRLRYAAALALLITATWLLFPKKKPESDLAAFIPLETGLPNLLSSADNLDKWRPAMQAFTQENYSKAISELDKITDNQPNNDTLLYFSGVAAFKLQSFDKAILTLLKLQQQPDSPYAADGEYFLALAYWQSGQTDKARSALKSIANQQAHPFAEAAKKILSRHF
jgi:predicted Zn-dependent protease